MPAKIHQAIARQWQLLKLLPSRGPGKSARELAELLGQEGFEVTKRTVERDLNELLCLFPIVCNDKGTPYGWHWLENTHLDLPSLAVSDALTLRLLEDYLKPILPATLLNSLTARFELAKKKLERLDELPVARWADKVRVVAPTLHLLPPQVDLAVQETVHQALLADEQVEVSYQPPHKEEPSALLLHPLGLIQRGPITYLVATAFEYEDVRLYAMHRIKEAKRLGKKCHRPENFSIDNYLATGALDFGDGKSIRFEAIVSDFLAALLRETPLSKDMELREGETGCLLSCTVIDSWQLHWWILSLGDEIEVLAPDNLRKEISRVLKMAARKYAG
jgi:predicted DNA-binding transcriptional regulator YafY